MLGSVPNLHSNFLEMLYGMNSMNADAMKTSSDLLVGLSDENALQKIGGCKKTVDSAFGWSGVFRYLLIDAGKCVDKNNTVPSSRYGHDYSRTTGMCWCTSGYSNRRRGILYSVCFSSFGNVPGYVGTL